MAVCPRCQTPNREGARFCAGSGFNLPAGAVPVTPAPPATPPATGAGLTGRLPPNAAIASRYLIVRQVGQGGMAAVYYDHALRPWSPRWGLGPRLDQSRRDLVCHYVVRDRGAQLDLRWLAVGHAHWRFLQYHVVNRDHRALHDHVSGTRVIDV